MLGLVEREGLVSLAVERHSAAAGGTPPQGHTAAGFPGPPPRHTAIPRTTAARAPAPARRTRGLKRPFVLQSHLTERHVDTLLARSTTHDDRAVVDSGRAVTEIAREQFQSQGCRNSKGGKDVSRGFIKSVTVPLRTLTDRQTDRQFGRKTHSEQLGCCATPTTLQMQRLTSEEARGDTNGTNPSVHAHILQRADR